MKCLRFPYYPDTDNNFTVNCLYKMDQDDQEIDQNLIITLEYPDGTNYTIDVSPGAEKIIKSNKTDNLGEPKETFTHNELSENGPKERKRDPEKWKRNKRKLLRACGLTYENSCGNIIQGKTFSYVTKCCERKCHGKFSQNLQEKIFREFYDLADFNAQSAFIFYHIKVKPVSRHYSSLKIKQKTNTRNYFLPNEDNEDVIVCKNFFKSILLISDGRIGRLLNCNNSSFPPKDKRGRRAPANKTSDEKIKQVCRFIPKLEALEDIKPIVNVRALYKEYCLCTTDAVSEKTFRNILHSHWKRSVIESSNANDKGNNVVTVNSGVECFDSNGFENIYHKAAKTETETIVELVTADGELSYVTNVSSGNEAPSDVEEIIIITDTDEQKCSPVTLKSKQRERKLKRNSGLPYTNTKGTCVPGKCFSVINNCCLLKCYTKFSKDLQMQIFENYYSTGNFDEQNAFIFNQVKVVPVARHYKSLNIRQKNRSRKYYLPYHEYDKDKQTSVCKTFFKKLLSISDGRIDRVLKSKDPKKAKQSLTPPKDQRGRHRPGNKTADYKIQEVFAAIASFTSDEKISFMNKVDRKTWNIRLMYNNYCDSNADPVSESVFRTIFKKRFNLLLGSGQ